MKTNLKTNEIKKDLDVVTNKVTTEIKKSYSLLEQSKFHTINDTVFKKSQHKDYKEFRHELNSSKINLKFYLNEKGQKVFGTKIYSTSCSSEKQDKIIREMAVYTVKYDVFVNNTIVTRY